MDIQALHIVKKIYITYLAQNVKNGLKCKLATYTANLDASAFQHMSMTSLRQF